MKLYLLMAGCIISCSFVLFSTTAVGKKVELTAIMENCGGELAAYKFDGVGFHQIDQSKATEDNTFNFSFDKGYYRIIYLGQNDGPKKPIIIADEDKILIKGSCGRNIRSAQVIDSDLNKQYNQLINQMMQRRQQRQGVLRKLQQSIANPEALSGFQKELVNHDVENLIFIDSVMQINSFFGHLLAVNSYQSYAHDSKGHPNEMEHFGMEYFTNVPLEDKMYDEITFLFEAYREFATQLGKMNLPEAQIEKYIDNSLKRIAVDRPAYKTALGGIVLGLQAANHPSFIKYGSIFTAKYPSEGRPHIANLVKHIESSKAIMKGGTAPDFEANTPEGATMKLSDLKGDYLLIDFWASWCGPCRKENPAVVKLYNKYNDKGFNILSVSLDKNKEKWINAIAKDSLVWDHVSDLKGWQSGPAQQYGVRSIPSTFLLDKEGKIIARNLRAHQLEGKLKEIFGE